MTYNINIAIGRRELIIALCESPQKGEIVLRSCFSIVSDWLRWF